jgi:hypothetical protein
MLRLFKESATYREAVECLAGNGSLNDRLERVLLEIATLPPDAFAGFPKFKAEHNAILSKGTAKQPRLKGEGSIHATTANMHWRRATEISSAIVALAFAIADARE